jgi:3-dehydroquinate synthase
VVKAGFIKDAGLLELLAGPGHKLFRDRQLRDRERLAEIIGRAAAIKAEVVAADEREGDLRRILNFGHTLGHAFEKASHFKLKHGEAVALGMAAALDFSVQLTGLEAGAASEGKELLVSLGLPVSLPDFSVGDILKALKVDKKKQEERLVFVLLKKLGEAVAYPDVPLGKIEDWLRANGAG